MSYSKTIAIGSMGSLAISEAAASAKLVLGLSAESGGSLNGVLKGVVSAEIDISGIVLLQAAAAVLEAKYPAEASLIAGLEGIIQAASASL